MTRAADKAAASKRTSTHQGKVVALPTASKTPVGAPHRTSSETETNPRVPFEQAVRALMEDYGIPVS